jgi:hypothetical protein
MKDHVKRFSMPAGALVAAPVGAPVVAVAWSAVAPQAGDEGRGAVRVTARSDAMTRGQILCIPQGAYTIPQ